MLSCHIISVYLYVRIYIYIYIYIHIHIYLYTSIFRLHNQFYQYFILLTNQIQPMEAVSQDCKLRVHKIWKVPKLEFCCQYLNSCGRHTENMLSSQFTYLFVPKILIPEEFRAEWDVEPSD